MRYISVFFLSFLASVAVTTAQESTVSSGGDASDNSGSVSYSVGQVATSTHLSSGGSVAEGVQQPFEISVISGIEEKDIQLTSSAFPNPTNGSVTLLVEEHSFKNTVYMIYDLNGRLMESKKIVAGQTTLNIDNYQPSIYFVKVFRDNKEIKTFKIIKY